MKTILLGLALAAFLATTAKADIIENFTWVPDAAKNPNASSGVYTLDISTVKIGKSFQTTYSVTTFSWSDGFGTVDSYFLNHLSSILDPLLPDGDSLLLGIGYTSLSVESDEVIWGVGRLPDESEATDPDNRNANYLGDWVPQSAVPEPTTILSGALALLPFCFGAVRMLRKKHAT